MDLKLARSFIGRTVSRTRYDALKRKGLKFEIDTEYVMELVIRQKGRCALTGWELEFVRGGSFDGKNPRGAVMDRIDSSLGYIRGNIQLTCGMPNQVKSHLSMADFTAICRAVAENC